MGASFARSGRAFPSFLVSFGLLVSFGSKGSNGMFGRTPFVRVAISLAFALFISSAFLGAGVSKETLHFLSSPSFNIFLQGDVLAIKTNQHVESLIQYCGM